MADLWNSLGEVSPFNSLGEENSFNSLSVDEKRVLLEVMSIEIKRREGALKPIKLRDIVPIEQWINSEYFLGPDYSLIYPYWKEFICEIYRKDRKKDNRITEVVISGSIGIGKSTVGELLLLRRIYELSCYKNINALFKLMSKTSIVFLYFSLNKTQAERTGYGDLIGWLDNSPYFREHFPRHTKLNSLILLPENMMVAFGSRASDSIGMSMMGSILDEANFFLGESKEANGGSSNKVGELYSSILNRSKSRFVIEGGDDYSLNVLVSSSTHESSFTEQRIKAGKDDPHVTVRSPTLWDVKPSSYCGEKFFVFKGNNLLDPYVIESVEDVSQYRLSEGMLKCSVDGEIKDILIIKEELEKIPETKRVDFLSVPIELRKGFETNIMQSLQDIGGVSVSPTGRLFTSKPVYAHSCKPGLEHPFTKDALVISTGDNILIQDFLRKDYVFRDRTKKRFLHIDQSIVTDFTGISSVFVKDIYEENGIKKSIISTDFMLRIMPPKAPKKIALYKIRDFVVFLNRVVGLDIGLATYDIFNSEESRQILQEMGINVGYQSVDRNDKAYVDAVTLLYEDRVELYDYEPFREELFNLIHYREIRKINHPKKKGDGTFGSKDVSDSWVGAVQNALITPFAAIGTTNTVEDFLRANGGAMGALVNGQRVFKDLNVLINEEIERQMNDFDEEGY